MLPYYARDPPFQLAAIDRPRLVFGLALDGHARAQARDCDAACAEVEQAQAESQSCCEPKPNCCDLPTADCEEPPKPIDPAKHCAICFLKSHLTDPPPLVLYTPYLGELDELAYLVEPSIRDELSAPAQLRGRAPPA